MAVFSPAPGVAQCVFAGLYGNSETIVTVMHLQKKNDAAFEPWTQATLRLAAQRMSVAFQRFLPSFSSQVAYNEIRTRDLSSATGAVDLFSVPLPGGSPSQATAPNNAILLRWRTGQAGKGANGRSFFPGATEGVVDPLGRLDPAFMNTVNGQAVQFLADVNGPTSATLLGAPLDLIVLHKAKGVPLFRSGNPVLVGKVSNVIGTQRRRLPKRA